MSDDDLDNGEPRYSILFSGESIPSAYLKKDGSGTATFSNLDSYTGSYLQGKRHGPGVYTFANGVKYSGEYVNGMKEGQGTMTNLDGSVYTGQWKQDKRDGEGTYTYASGDKYTGAWRSGVKHGRGTYSYAGDHSYIVGSFSNNQLMHGEWIRSDTSRYIGSWKNSQPFGRGLQIFENGAQESGMYVQDRKGYRWIRDTKSPAVKTKSSVVPSAVPKPTPEEQFTQAQTKFIEDCIVRADQYDGISQLAPMEFSVPVEEEQEKEDESSAQVEKPAVAPKTVDGVPNFRRVVPLPAPPADDSGIVPPQPDNIFTSGQPTLAGLQQAVQYLQEQSECEKIVWVNLRDEPVVYVNQDSYVPREGEKVVGEEFNGVSKDKSTSVPPLTPEQLASLETALAQKLIKKIAQNANILTYFKQEQKSEDNESSSTIIKESQLEILPSEQDAGGNTIIRTMKQAFDLLIQDEDGQVPPEEEAHVQYVRVPWKESETIGKDGSVSIFDRLLSLIRTTSSAEVQTALVFNDTTGAGVRASYASVLATLYKTVKSAVVQAEEKEANAGNADAGGDDEDEDGDAAEEKKSAASDPTASRTDFIPRASLPAYDESSPDLSGEGQYSVIMKLVQAIPNGQRVKAEVDEIVSKTRSGVQGSDVGKDEIQACKESMEKELASLTESGASPDVIESRKTYWLNQAKSAVERYAYLILFHSYLKSHADSSATGGAEDEEEDAFDRESFVVWLEKKKEWKDIVGSKEQGAIKEFAWQ